MPQIEKNFLIKNAFEVALKKIFCLIEEEIFFLIKDTNEGNDRQLFNHIPSCGTHQLSLERLRDLIVFNLIHLIN